MLGPVTPSQPSDFSMADNTSSRLMKSSDVQLTTTANLPCEYNDICTLIESRARQTRFIGSLAALCHQYTEATCLLHRP